jgi:hypothetical protein
MAVFLHGTARLEFLYLAKGQVLGFYAANRQKLMLVSGCLKETFESSAYKQRCSYVLWNENRGCT